MNGPIVVGIDSSQQARAAAEVAAELARALDRSLLLAHVAPDPPTFPYGDARVREVQRRGAGQQLDSLLESIASEFTDVVAEGRVLFGTPVEGLISLCREEEAELLVVGSRGRGNVAAALLGSNSARLATESECPVVVVPPPAAERVSAWTEDSSNAADAEHAPAA